MVIMGKNRTMPLKRYIFTFAAAIAIHTSAFASDGNIKLSTSLNVMLLKLADLKDSEPKVTSTNGAVLIGNHTVRIVPVSETSTKANGKFIEAARFEISIDGVKNENLTVGSIGIGNSAQDAADTSVQEWYMTVGSAILQTVSSSPSKLTVSNFTVRAGLMGIRGDPPKGWVDGSDDMHRKILAVIDASNPIENTSEVHVLDLKVVVAPNGTIHGECRNDGKTSEVLLSTLKKLSWPSTSTGYMFKQAYVLRKHSGQ